MHSVRFRLMVLVALGALALGGCYNFSSYQTAVPLKQGQVAAGIGVGYPTLLSVKTVGRTDGGTVEGEVEVPNMSFPYNDYWLRVGLGHNLDLGIKWTIPAGLGLDLRIRFLKVGNFSMALDPGFAFHSFLVLHRLDVELPLILSGQLSRAFHIYGGVKIAYSRWICSASESCDADLQDANSVAFGGFFGVSIEFWKMFIRPEVHYYRMQFPGLNGYINIVQPGIGIGFKFGGAPDAPPPPAYGPPPPGYAPPPTYAPPPAGAPPAGAPPAGDPPPPPAGGETSPPPPPPPPAE